MGGESQKRKQPGEKFSNISIDLGCFHLAQDGIWGQTRLGSPPPPAPSPFIYAGATLPGCKPRPAAPAAASPPSRSFNPILTAPFSPNSCPPATALSYVTATNPSCQPSAVQCFPSSPHQNVLLLNPCTEQGAANEQDAGREQGFLCSQHKHSLAQLSVPAPRVGANG